VFALLVPSCQHVWNRLLTTCNNFVDIIRLVTRLFQQVRYSHDITILLQPCIVNLVTFLLYHDCVRLVSDLLEQPCNKSDNAIKLVTNCQQLVPNLLQQLGTSEYTSEYTRKSCSKSANKPSTSCVRTACLKLSPSLEQLAVNNM
jgi:hypothetical protein